MAIITLQDVTIGYYGPPLLDQVNCQIHAGDRIGLLGRNGAGKSTLIKLLTGAVQPDHGRITIQPGIQVAVLDQEVPMDLIASIRDVVTQGIRINNQIELESWQADHAVDQILSRMELDGDQRFEQLSAGMKRRVLLAKALVAKPDFLLLDEPTNHLDIDAIIWLEDFLRKQAASFMFVTHDRVFLQRLANRILEIDRGQIFDWSCDYQTFLKRKEQVLAAEEKENQLFDKRLAEEEVWIRQGIKARRTRNQGRVRALKAMRDERSQRRDKLGTAKLQIQAGQKSGNLVFSMEDVFYHYPHPAKQSADPLTKTPLNEEPTPILNGFSTVVMRGDKVGIVGPNGVGKSTLIKLMLGQLSPISGTVRTGTNLEIAWFDQLRSQLDPESTVQEEVGDGNDNIQIGSSKKHILGYLQDFLFTPDRARTQIKFLSGGERNRILLAKLFAKPANLIVMDEPTNDLDAETMELLEDRLVEFSGTVLVVSHDRAFLNNLVTSTIAFEPGGIFEYVGGYDDWQRQYQQKLAAQSSAKTQDRKEKQNRQVRGGATAEEATGLATAISAPVPSPANAVRDASEDSSSRPSRKIKYKEKIELEKLPARIEVLETEINQLNETICDPEFYRLPKEQIVAAQEGLKQKEADLATALDRWAELDELDS